MFALGLTLSVFFLIQVYFLCLLNFIFNKVHKCQAKKYISAHPVLFFYPKLFYFFYKQKSFEALILSCVYSKNIARFFLGISSFIFILALEDFKVSWTGLPFILLGLLLIYVLISDFLPRLISVSQAERLFAIAAPTVSIYQTSLLFILVPFLKVVAYAQTKHHEKEEHQYFMKEKVYDLIEETWPTHTLEARDRQLIESILKFKQRIVREVMVPRSDVFAIEASTPIKSLAKELFEENYSRIPVYKGTLDNVIGILFYKDLLSIYLQSSTEKETGMMEQTIENFVKKPLYTAETTRVPNLLQEFLHKQQHLALVVDEFGSVEGLVTIEDLLEEIVGEIEDEYDEEDLKRITQQKDNWIVDGKLSLHELEEIAHLKIPHHGDYDTIGGYIIHRAGKIPEQGLIISHDHFDLEVLVASERHIDKVRITPPKKLKP